MGTRTREVLVLALSLDVKLFFKRICHFVFSVFVEPAQLAIERRVRDTAEKGICRGVCRWGRFLLAAQAKASAG